MSASCCCTSGPDPHRGNAAYRRVLWIVLAINAVMFVVEIGAGLAAGSASLQADALDFLVVLRHKLRRAHPCFSRRSTGSVRG